MNPKFYLLALRELGLRSMLHLGRYRLGILTGRLEYQVAAACRRAAAVKTSRLRSILWLPSRETLLEVMGADGYQELLQESDEITAGKYRFFGGQAQPIYLTPQPPLRSWTAYENSANGQDIKFVWEPARFGWVFTLGRAYLASGDERYSQAFWEQFDIFKQANPPCLGPNWSSAQEVALRLIAFTFAAQVFTQSSRTTNPRMLRLLRAIAVHAARIPPSMDYARAQNNNHLLSEAAALYTAGLALPGHPSARGWRKSGWRWFHEALPGQIDQSGAYIQHSPNYHRLILQLALWMAAVSESAGDRFPEKSLHVLASATGWLQAIVDPISGAVPNLGPNDSAYIFPLAKGDARDFRPVLTAARQRFLGEAGDGDHSQRELAIWLRGKPNPNTSMPELRRGQHVSMKGIQAGASIAEHQLHLTPHILRFPQSTTWAYLRAANFISRPGHADQLHLDLWWRGINVAMDPGTFSYNAFEPWDNALSGTAVHNTVLVEDRDQMTRAGRFLWVNWAQAQITDGVPGEDGAWLKLTAHHTGYKRMGIIHKRSVNVLDEREWQVLDEILPARKVDRPIHSVLHWLLPDWEWEVISQENLAISLRLHSPHGNVDLEISSRYPASASEGKAGAALNAQESLAYKASIVRQGQQVLGDLPSRPVLGWFSPSYGVKMPAFSLRVELSGLLPYAFTTRWRFPVHA